MPMWSNKTTSVSGGARVMQLLFAASLLVFAPASVAAQTATNLAALAGLVPFGTLLNTPIGQAAMASNYVVTGSIQRGTSSQPLLQSFPMQRVTAIKDAFITAANGTELADALGTKLGAAYAAAATYTSTDDGTTSTYTNVSPNVANVIAYTAGLTGADAASAKYFFGNATVVSKTGSAPISKQAAEILTAAGATTDVMGKAYHLPAGAPGADRFGDSRPFQTETDFATFSGLDFFGAAATNENYLRGPLQNLVDSPSYPSGHTTYGYTESLLLAIMVPARYTQMIARGAEYGNDRIILGAHYAMDVIGGRTLAYYDVAHLLAQDPLYVGQTLGQVTIVDYTAALRSATADLTKALAAACGTTVAVCAAADTSRFHDSAANEAFYESTQTYGLSTVYSTVHTVEDVGALAPEAGHLLTAAFPALSLAQADTILTRTEGPGGGFLDNGSAFGVYSRLDLFAAGKAAERLSSAASGRGLQLRSER